MNTCCWINSDGNPCGLKTRYTIKSDDDGNLKRVHDAFCPAHRNAVNAMEEKRARGVCSRESCENKLADLDDGLCEACARELCRG